MNTIFVFYSFCIFSEKINWTYDLPEDWKWIGKGSTAPLFDASSSCKRIVAYTHEEQFLGTDKEVIVDYLKRYFDKLKDDEVLSKYSIISDYDPYENE